MSTDNLGNENIDMAVGYSNGYKQGYEDGKKDAVKHGRWVLVGYGKDGGWNTCCECAYVYKHDEHPSNYCPNCGAKMDGDAND